jgi:GT2 family glycosyltransferase
LSSPRVTAAIVAHNAEATIRQAVESLQRQTPPPDEILVIDDGSQDRTAPVAEECGARVVRRPECGGVAAARNTALREAAGEILVFIDADATAGERMIELMLREFSREGVAGVGGQGDEVVREGLANRWRAIFWRQTHGPQRQQHAWMLPGLCCAYRVDVLRKIGGFDERFRTNGEDVDIGLRLHQTHHRLVYRPDIVVQHHRRDTVRSLLAMVFRHSRWQAIAVKKNHWRSGFLLLQSLKWIVITTGSSIKRHHSPTLTLASPLFAGWAVIGRITGLLQPRLSATSPPTES